MPTQSTRIGSDTMKVLVCASARAEIVIKCLRELDSKAEITIIAPAPVASNLAWVPDKADLIRLSGDSFGACPEHELDALQGVRFDTAVIVSGGLGFTGFHNVAKSISGLRFRELVFYNKLGRKERVPVAIGAGRVLERTAVKFLMGLFKAVRPVELLIERIYIQCAELLVL